MTWNSQDSLSSTELRQYKLVYTDLWYLCDGALVLGRCFSVDVLLRRFLFGCSYCTVHSHPRCGETCVCVCNGMSQECVAL